MFQSAIDLGLEWAMEDGTGTALLPPHPLARVVYVDLSFIQGKFPKIPCLHIHSEIL